MLKLQIIVASTREGRHADTVLRWLLPVVKAHGAFDAEVLDLREWQLPLFQETLATIGDFRNPTYSQPIVKKWNQKIAEGDAFLIITAEYNHSIPGVLKNARTVSRAARCPRRASRADKGAVDGDVGIREALSRPPKGGWRRRNGPWWLQIPSDQGGGWDGPHHRRRSARVWTGRPCRSPAPCAAIVP